MRVCFVTVVGSGCGTTAEKLLPAGDGDKDRRVSVGCRDRDRVDRHHPTGR